MPLNLAHHLKVSRCGIFYFRMSVPVVLRSTIGKREIIRSLRTRSPAAARKLAYHFAFKTHALFEQMAYDPKKFNPADLSTFPTSDEMGSLSTYKIKVGGVEFETDGSEEEHRRVLALINTLPPAAFTPAPAAPVPQYIEPQPEHTISISKAAEAYLPKLATQNRNAAKRSINRFIEHRGDVEIHTVREVDVVTWNNKLLTTPKPNGEMPKAKTVDCAIQHLHGLFQWAQTRAYIHRSATPLVTAGKRNQSKRTENENAEGAEPFSVEQLKQIFNPKTYETYCVNVLTKKYSLSRKWMPLIALFTGMRKEEIAQLTVTDIITENGSGVHFIDINRNGGKKTKNVNSIRRIPIHDTLLKLGFLDYVRTRKGKLFDETGTAVSKAFVRYLVKLGIKQDGDRGMVLHSFRDTFNNTLLEPSLNVPDRLRYALMGHSTSGDSNETNYTRKILVSSAKKDGIDKLDFVETVGVVTHRLVFYIRERYGEGTGGSRDGRSSVKKSAGS